MKIAITFGLSLLLAPLASAGGGDKPTGKVVSTSLTKIIRSPQAFKGIWVRFDAQFGSVGKISNPFFTQFIASNYTNFYMWPSEQKIWEKEQYENLFGLLFIRKENKKARNIFKMNVYQRFTVTGVVRNTFQDMPWIEVTDFEPVSNQVNTATLGHMYRGETYMKKREWKKAITELSLAPAEDLPVDVRAYIHKDLAVCYLRLGETASATAQLAAAVELSPNLDRETKEMAQLAQIRPEAFLDRAPNSVQVEEFERPMWEAFEKVTDESATGGTDTPKRSAPAPK